MARATLAVSTLAFGVVLSLVEEPPQAPTRAAQASAVIAAMAPRGDEAARGSLKTRAILKVGRSVCMRAY
jgi:hypothetical protein